MKTHSKLLLMFLASRAEMGRFKVCLLLRHTSLFRRSHVGCVAELVNNPCFYSSASRAQLPFDAHTFPVGCLNRRWQAALLDHLWDSSPPLPAAKGRGHPISVSKAHGYAPDSTRASPQYDLVETSMEKERQREPLEVCELGSVVASLHHVEVKTVSG